MGKNKRWKTGVLFVLPCFLFIFAFMIYPICSVGYLSFHEYSPLKSPETFFVGLKNYEWMAGSYIVSYSLYVTILFTVVSVAIEFIVGLYLANALAKQMREKSSKIGKGLNRVLRSIFILPFAVPAVVAAVAWKMMLQPQFGPVNALLGVDVAWTSQYPLLSVIVADAWKMTPFILFILFAAIMSISAERFEAIKIDGASGWQEFRYVTFPAILPVIAVAIAFRAVDAFTKIFDIVYMMTGGGPGMQTQVFPLLIWKTAFNYFHFGEASALAVAAIAISLIFGSILILRRRSK